MPPSRELPVGMRSILTRPDGYGIVHVLGEPRKALHRLLEQHYTGTSGGSGWSFGVIDPDNMIVGGAIIGSTASASCDRSIVASSHRVCAIKRSFILDHVPSTSTDHPLQTIPVPEYMLRGISWR